MNVDVKNSGKTGRKLIISADSERLEDIKKRTLNRLGKDVTVKGFRKGKAPGNKVEKELGENTLQSEVLEDAVNFLYLLAINQEDLRPIDKPRVEVKKYVPYSSLEFVAEINVVPKPKIGDYKKIKKSLPKVSVSDKEVKEVLSNLQNRSAERKPADRKSKVGDEIIIDFEGADKKGEAVEGAKGSDYPLLLGSKTFIPGFEDKLIGSNKGDDVEFEITFPKDYGSKKMAGAKVDFKVKVKQVNEVVKPKLDDKFASQAGPFENMAQLKKDITVQLNQRKQQEAINKLKDEIIEELLEDSQIDVPETLVEDQMKALEQELTQNLAYRGLTPNAFFEQQGMSKEEYAEKVLKPQAKKRVRVGLLLAEVVSKEKLEVTDDEIEIRIQLLQGQYQDPKMQSQFETLEAKQDLANRMLTEKAVNVLYQNAIK